MPSCLRGLPCEDRHPVTDPEYRRYGPDPAERRFLPWGASCVEVCRLQAGIERIHVLDGKARIFETAFDAPPVESPVESPEVPRRIVKGKPLTSTQAALRIDRAGYERANIGSADDQQSARFHDSIDFFELGDRAGHMLDHVQDGNHVEAAGGKSCRAQRALRSVEL